jgi:hypothetical protein
MMINGLPYSSKASDMMAAAGALERAADKDSCEKATPGQDDVKRSYGVPSKRMRTTENLWSSAQAVG